jgi:hypothetical protein
MTPLGAGEVVWMEKPSKGGAPTSFTWRGRHHTIRLVEAWREAGASLRLFRVRTTGGMRCLISLNLGQEIWRMERVLPQKDG